MAEWEWNDTQMELRYLGFEQLPHARGYRFDLQQKGGINKELVITVDLALFLVHGVGIQEAPGLCARKLASDLENCSEGAHELTTEDVRAYADARTRAAAKKAESRSHAKRPKPSASQSPWQDPRR